LSVIKMTKRVFGELPLVEPLVQAADVFVDVLDHGIDASLRIDVHVAGDRIAVVFGN